MSAARRRHEVAVIGGGFGGTLVAMCLASQGRSVVVLERGRHPRFAIGESTTPLANLVLKGLCERYGLDELLPLCKYGTWKATYPELRCGPKRGFSFFAHEPGSDFGPRNDHKNELFVAANASEAAGDTQWLREDLDAFFATAARARGVSVLEGVEVTGVRRENGWTLETIGPEGTRQIQADFVIDASGGLGPLKDALGLEDHADDLATQSHAVFSHFEGVRPWGAIYEESGGSLAGSPFHPDAAALHHILEEGWMWALAFDHGVTSVGAVLTGAPTGASPDRTWRELLARYPSVAAQMADARPTRPLTGTALLQRRLRPSAGNDWGLLPAAAYFIDPLLSPGNAHTLYGVERLARALSVGLGAPDLAEALKAYDDSLQNEVDLLDMLIHGCQAAFCNFELMTAFSLYYFTGAIWSEVRREEGKAGPDDGFLNAHDERFRGLVQAAYGELIRLVGAGAPSAKAVSAFTARVRKDIQPYDLAGLGDPTKLNRYPYV